MRIEQQRGTTGGEARSRGKQIVARALHLQSILARHAILQHVGCLLLVPARARNAYEALQQLGCLVCQLVCHLALLSFPMSKVTQ